MSMRVARFLCLCAPLLVLSVSIDGSSTAAEKTPSRPAQKSAAFNHGSWPFQPPVRPEVPEVKNAAWVVNPIDAFILDQLEEVDLAPSPQADKLTLLRR